MTFSLDDWDRAALWFFLLLTVLSLVVVLLDALRHRRRRNRYWRDRPIEIGFGRRDARDDRNWQGQFERGRQDSRP